MFMDAKAGVGSSDQRWAAEVWVRNALNKSAMQLVADAPLQGSGTTRAITQGLAASSTQLYAGLPIEPRTFGVTLRAKF